MNPIIAAALIRENRDNLLRQAEQHRRTALVTAARPDAEHATVVRRAAAWPFVLFQGWLARGYL
jgi:hypothetical protein